MNHSEDVSDEPLPLRDRIPDYAVTFGIGLAVSFAIGLVIWLISDIKLSSTIGYTTILYGVVLMLAGGASGGGYANLGMGAVGSMFGGRRIHEAEPDGSGSAADHTRMSAKERLDRGLRPEANPRAFWQVIGGIAYVVIGLVIVIVWP